MVHKKTVSALLAALSLSACSAGVSVRVADSDKKNPLNVTSQATETSGYYSMASNPAAGTVKKSSETK